MSARKKKAYYVLISVVGVALIVDRLFLNSGRPDSASAVQIFVDAPAAELAKEDEDATLAIPELHFPDHLPPFIPWAMKRDFFAPPIVQKDDASAPMTGNSNSDAKKFIADGSMKRAAFETDVHLNGVIVSEGLQIAVTDGHWLRMGQSHHGCTLVRMSGNMAVFKCDDGEATLQVNVGISAPQD